MYLYSHNSKDNQIIFRQFPLSSLIFVWNITHLICSICKGNTAEASSGHIFYKFPEFSNLKHHINKLRPYDTNEKNDHKSLKQIEQEITFSGVIECFEPSVSIQLVHESRIISAAPFQCICTSVPPLSSRKK